MDADVVGKDIGVIVGPGCSYCAVEMPDAIKAAEVVMIAPTTQSPDMTGLDDNGFYFRTIPSDADLGAAQGNYLAGEVGVTKLGIIAINDAWGGGTADETTKAFAAAVGGEVETIVLDIRHEQGVLDASAALDQLDQFGVDGLFIIGYDTDPAVAGLMLELGFYSWSGATPHYELSSGFSVALWDVVADSALLTGMGGMAPKAPNNAASQHFADGLMAAANESVAAYYGEVYDAVYMAAIGMALAEDPTSGPSIKSILTEKTKAGTQAFAGDWAAIQAAITADGMVDYMGATGDIDFDENGDVKGNFSHQSFNSSGAYETIGCWKLDGSECQ
jgi:branched-chain amino acid transport system substrate-binding protein